MKMDLSLRKKVDLLNSLMDISSPMLSPSATDRYMSHQGKKAVPSETLNMQDQVCFRDGNNIHDKHNITSNSNSVQDQVCFS